MYREMIRPNLKDRLVPGIRAFLEKRRDWPMAVATNAEPANVKFVLDNAGLREYFQVIVDGSQVDRPKPFPDVFLKAASLLDHPPHECIVFEDSLTGIQAARASGARVVGLTTTLAEFDDVDLTITDFCDSKLEPWLQQLHVSR